jgi:hypothetical protein
MLIFGVHQFESTKFPIPRHLVIAANAGEAGGCRGMPAWSVGKRCELRAQPGPSDWASVSGKPNPW